MATMRFDKLVRDRIPEVLDSKGVDSETRILSSEEYLKALKLKLVEEAGELDRALTSEDLKGEIADVMEVLDAIAAAYGFSKGELLAAQDRKRAERGGFAQRIFLMSTTDRERTS